MERVMELKEGGRELERARRMMRISFCAVSVVLMLFVTGRSRYMMYGTRSACISPVRRCVLRLVRASRGYAAAGLGECVQMQQPCRAQEPRLTVPVGISCSLFVCLFVCAAGNPLPGGFLSEPCYNVVYLELAACRLTVLPANFAQLVPNVRVLNLNYNFLEDTRPLEGLTRLRKLTVIGSRIRSTRMLVRTVRGMADIEMLDFR